MATFPMTEFSNTKNVSGVNFCVVFSFKVNHDKDFTRFRSNSYYVLHDNRLSPNVFMHCA